MFKIISNTSLVHMLKSRNPHKTNYTLNTIYPIKQLIKRQKKLLDSRQEDIFQLEIDTTIFDIGVYDDSMFTLIEVKDSDWENPIVKKDFAKIDDAIIFIEKRLKIKL